MADRPRLIEVAFPLKETSIDSVHEKNVRHGHISTLHIWPARRPLAASRAALIATLLPDPGNEDARNKLLEKLGGKVVEKIEKKKRRGKITETHRDVTEGGILHWGRESSPELDWFREKIVEAYGGRAPRVLDPFAGGGAIPLEAMRLGCDVTAVDINSVAWFILKCTLEYPQKLAGKKLPLPKFAMELPEFRKAWEDALTKTGKRKSRKQKPGTRDMWEGATPEGDLAWHVRAWGHWVLEQARKDLEKYYPVVDGKPTVAYLWARTVKCKDCGATIPLLKTRWLCRKDNNRVVLAMKPRPDRKGVSFEISYPTAMQAKDKTAAAGTMSRTGAQCPCCPAMMTMEDLRIRGQAGELKVVMTAVVVEGTAAKEYRLPTADEIAASEITIDDIERTFANVPYGVPDDPLPSKEALGFRVPLYGVDRWSKLFTPRQLVAMGTFVVRTREAFEALREMPYDEEWREAILGFLALGIDRLADRSSMQCRPDPSPTQSGIMNTFSRFAFPMVWDFIEAAVLRESSGGYLFCLEWIAKVVEENTRLRDRPSPRVLRQSAKAATVGTMDVVVTDPPYYDAIPYSDLMDFFYVWLRRTLHGVSSEVDVAFKEPLGPKWDHAAHDGELIDDASRFDGDKSASKQNYEDGMAHAFKVCFDVLAPDGRLVVVFAHKEPDAWETLVSAIIRAGFVVDGSWPIQTERAARTRSLSSAALSSSVWLVCKKRPETARRGWDNRVLEEMRVRIANSLHSYWDAGIRGPDFVWAATGPALEAYSKHPFVQKANESGQVPMTVSEFLRHVRRIVVDFAVGRVLTRDNSDAVISLDDVTTYYLLHRHYFGLDKAPVGAAILYAVSCGLSNRDLLDRHDLLVGAGGKDDALEEDDDDDDDGEENEDEEEETGTVKGPGHKVKLKEWSQRRGKNLGLDIEGNPAPLIDQIHHLMHLWRAGDQLKVNQYLDTRALWKSQIFHQVLQALIELAPEGSEERALLESISNHVGIKGKGAPRRQLEMHSPDPTHE